MKRTFAESVDSRLSTMNIQDRAEAIAQLQALILGYELSDALELAAGKEPEPEVCCTHCASDSFTRNGYAADGRQRYLCKHCGKTFTPRKKSTVISRSRLPRAKWMRYINCFVDGLPVAKCAANCGVSLPTAYYMRLRILKVIQKNLPAWRVPRGGEATLDETFVLESFKGNRKKSKGFEMPRPAFARGRLSQRGPKRPQGLNRADWLCVLTGVDVKGDAFFEAVTRGVLDRATCRERLEDRIEAGATVVTDDHSAYKCLEGMGAKRRVRNSKVPVGDINKINTLHSALKNFFAAKNGVSSRRLHLYLAEFAWRWSFVRSDERTEDTARQVISQIARTDAAGMGAELDSDDYPFFEYWGTPAGEREGVRQKLAARQFCINRDMLKAGDDPDLQAECRMRQRKLDMDMEASGIGRSGVGKGVYDSKATGDRRACTASVLRAGKKPNAAAVRRFFP